ncbi:unnamed protein product [Diamesa serratosioi]
MSPGATIIQNRVWPLEKFLCFSLESAATFLGWFGVLVSGVLITLLTLGGVVLYYIDLKEGYKGLILIFGSILLVYSIFNYIVSLSMLHAIKKKNHRPLMSWLFTHGLFIAFGFLTLHPAGIISSVFSIYTWLCVFSLYKQFKIHNDTSEVVSNDINLRAVSLYTVNTEKV